MQLCNHCRERMDALQGRCVQAEWACEVCGDVEYDGLFLAAERLRHGVYVLAAAALAFAAGAAACRYLGG